MTGKYDQISVNINAKNNICKRFFSAQDSPSQLVSGLDLDCNCAVFQIQKLSTTLNMQATSANHIESLFMSFSQRSRAFSHPGCLQRQVTLTKDTKKNCHGCVIKRKFMEKEEDKFFQQSFQSPYSQDFSRNNFKFLLYQRAAYITRVQFLKISS